MHDYFYELIRVAIGAQENLSRQPKSGEWVELYKIAQAQSLISVSFVALQKLGADLDGGFARIGMSEKLYLAWMVRAAEFSQNYGDIKALEDKLSNALCESGVKALLVKGTSLSLLYEDPTLRQFGDLDVYSPFDYDKVNEIVKSLASDYIEDYYRHTEGKVDGIMVENHKYLTDVRGQKRWNELENYLSQLASARLASRGVGGLYYPDDVFTVLFFVYHAQAHFLFERISMKFLVDWCLLLKNRNDAPGRVVDERLKQFGLMKFAACLTAICIKRLALPEQYVPVEVLKSVKELDEKTILCFEKDMFCSESHGFTSSSLIDRVKRGVWLFKNKWKIELFLDDSIYSFLWHKAVSIITFKQSKYKL